MYKQKLLILISLILLAIVPICILYINPFWGLMDDGGYLNWVKIIEAKGVWNATVDHIPQDINWGMLRPYFIAQIYYLYGVSLTNAIPPYMVNFLMVASILILFCEAFYRSPFKNKLEVLGQQKINRLFFFSAFFIFLFANPWLYYLFLLPSLQEKYIFLASALLVLWLGRARTQRAGNLSYWPVTFVLLALGFLTKGQFIATLPIYFLIQLTYDIDRTDKIQIKNFTRSLFVLFTGVLGAVLIYWIGKRGGYTSHYDSGNIIKTITASKSFWLLSSISIVCGSFVIYRSAKEGFKSLLSRAILIAPTIVLMCFLFLMLPWRLGGYLNSFTAPVFALILLAPFMIWRNKFKVHALLLMGLLSLLMASIKTYTLFSAHGDIRKIVYSPAAEALAHQNIPIFTSCLEGAGHLQYYFRTYGRNFAAIVLAADPNSPDPDARENFPNFLKNAKNNNIALTYWIEGEKYCPLPSKFSSLDATRKKILAGGKHSYSLRLVEIRLK